MNERWWVAIGVFGVLAGLTGCGDSAESRHEGDRGGAGGVSDGGGTAEVGGGGGDVEVLAWQQIPLDASSPIARSAHGFVHHAAEGRSYLVGGQPAGPVPVADTWHYEDDLWTEVPIDGGDLDARKSMRVVYDSARERLVSFGGIYGGLVVDPEFSDATRLFDDGAWTELDVAGDKPSPRSAYAMAYDEARDRVVLFGGGNNAEIFGDTWELDGTTWVLRSPVNAPSPRVHPRMVYDPIGKRSLLFGGSGLDPLNDLWAWDGTDWTEITPAGEAPAPRNRMAMTWDSKRHRVLVYGGTTTYPPHIDETNTFADLWAYDGDSWQLLSSDTGPGLRVGTQLAYDPETDRALMFGGSMDGSSSVHDMWSFGP